MEIRITILEKLAKEARDHGVPVELYIQKLLTRRSTETSAEELQATRRAIECIRELRKGNNLAGLQPKDLIHEGHRF